MSWWASDPFTTTVEKATSELLPTGTEDIALNLDIADQIKSKSVAAKHAMQVLKRRISHKNPNVVLLALGLTDISVKNGGDEFLTEVGSREFVDNLVSILQMPLAGGELNPDVKSRILALLQSWSQISEVRPGYMTYAASVYSQLRNEGYEFPPKDPVESVVSSSAAAFETRTMPEWVDGEVCLRCRTPFTTFTRKHHCRNCGNVFCHACSSKEMALPWFGVGQPVRVCDGCFARKSVPPKAAVVRRKSTETNHVTPYGRGGVASAHKGHTRSKTVDPARASAARRKEEEDLALAIKLSLQASGQSAPESSSVPSAPSQPSQPSMSGRQLEGTDEAVDAEDDPDLAAAIKASLETAPPEVLASQRQTGSPIDALATYAPSAPSAPSAPTASTFTPANSTPAAPAPSGPTLPSVELEPKDIDSLLSFSQTVSRLDQAIANGQAPPHMARPPPPVQSALEQSLGARPRLVRNLNEAETRLNRLGTMQAKLDYAVKLYDRLLDAQLASASQVQQPYGAQYVPYGQQYGYGQTHASQYRPEAYAHSPAHQQQAPAMYQQPQQPYVQPPQQSYIPPPASAYNPDQIPSPVHDQQAPAQSTQYSQQPLTQQYTGYGQPPQQLSVNNHQLASSSMGPGAPVPVRSESSVENAAPLQTPSGASAPVQQQPQEPSQQEAIPANPLYELTSPPPAPSAPQTQSHPVHQDPYQAPTQASAPGAPSAPSAPGASDQRPTYAQAAQSAPDAQAHSPTLQLPSAPSVPPATQQWLSGPQSAVPAQTPQVVAPAQPQPEISLIEF